MSHRVNNNSSYLGIENIQEAKDITIHAVWISVVATVLAGIIALLAGDGLIFLISVVMNGSIVWGIYKMSRIAAIIGLTLTIIVTLILLIANVPLSVKFILVPLLYAYINAVRGTFAYHKLCHRKF
ncbi:hypothetical protein RIVM261_041320 [Rivularia sp. IAM M-261]|nr:hypothetical protein RIVM261_041320 [Rivularia sp. IAM M-261]